MRKLLLIPLVAWAALVPAVASDARDFPPPTPFERIALSQLGYSNTTLRGELVGTDFFIPGPADFLLGGTSFLDLDIVPSQLLAKESSMVVLWNGVPIHGRQIAAGTGQAERVSIPISLDRIDPETNRLEIQAELRLVADTCDVLVESPARSITVLATTTIRYAYADPVVPRPAPVHPGLATYPLPFFSPTHPQPAPVRFIIPDRPTAGELTALAQVAAQLGQYAGFRGVKAELQRAGEVRESDLDRTHVVLIGRQQALPLLPRLTNTPLARDPDGRFLDERGSPIADDTGVVMVMQAPWSSGRAVLVVSGRTDEAVSKAALALSGRGAVEALRGTYAIVPDAAPFTAPPPATTTSIRLSDLGRTDDQINNAVGDRAISFTVFLPAVARDALVPFDVAVSHSALLDKNRSSMRVLVNDLPLESVALRDIPPVHGVHRFSLPGAALKPGANTLKVEFSLRLPRYGQCEALPIEQAWVVLHADSAISSPSAAGASAEPNLSIYPYPFQRSGRLDDTLIVVPTDLGANPQALMQFISDLGRGARATLLRPTVVSATDFDPARDAIDRDVILFGLAADDRVLRDLGARLPVQVGPDQRLLRAPNLTIRVSDLQHLGVVQEIASPWSADRAVMVVTGTSPDGLDLAVEAIRQRTMTGNVALASRQQPRPLAPGATPKPSPLAYGGPAQIPLDVSSYVLRPTIVAPRQEVRIPWVLIAAAVLGLFAVFVALAQAYEAFRTAGRP